MCKVLEKLKKIIGFLGMILLWPFHFIYKGICNSWIKYVLPILYVLFAIYVARDGYVLYKSGTETKGQFTFMLVLVIIFMLILFTLMRIANIILVAILEVITSGTEVVYLFFKNLCNQEENQDTYAKVNQEETSQEQAKKEWERQERVRQEWERQERVRQEWERQERLRQEESAINKQIDDALACFQLKRGCKLEEIRKRYIIMSQKIHPDTASNEVEERMLNEIQQNLNDKYHFLKKYFSENKVS